MELWAERWADNPRPFVWTKTAAEIMTKVSRGRATLHQIKSATALVSACSARLVR
jgi:hypothetical protein